MKENLFTARMIRLPLVIYASIYLNIDLRIQTNAHCPSQSYFRVILEGFIGITNNYKCNFFPPKLLLLNGSHSRQSAQHLIGVSCERAIAGSFLEIEPLIIGCSDGYRSC